MTPTLAPVATTILDTPSASWSGAYAVFQVRPSYSGPTVKARRSSDGATLDFYADRNGSFGTSLAGTGTPLTAWLNGTTGYVVVWYDQSGAGNHATQTDPNSQPIVDTVSKRIDFTAQGGQAFLNLPSGTVPEQTSYTVTAKHGQVNAHMGPVLFGGNCFSPPDSQNEVYRQANFFGVCNPAGTGPGSGDGYITGWFGDNMGIKGTYTPGNIVTYGYNGTARYVYVNGQSMGSEVSSGLWNGQSGNEKIGKDCWYSPRTCYLDGQLYFLHVFKRNLTLSDQAVVEGGISPGTMSVCILVHSCAQSLRRRAHARTHTNRYTHTHTLPSIHPSLPRCCHMPLHRTDIFLLR